MIIKINEESFKIDTCTERVTKANQTLSFVIIGDYSASFISEIITKEAEPIYTLIDDEGNERKFSGYVEISNIETYYEKNLSETSTTVTLKK